MAFLSTQSETPARAAHLTSFIATQSMQPHQDYGEFGDYVIFVDESGDACLDPISVHFPILNVSFCIIRKDHYIDTVVPRLQALKYRYFGHDQVILHEREIRRGRQAFAKLSEDKARHAAFEADLKRWIAESPFQIVSATVHKARLVSRYKHPFDPYHIAMRFCLERTQDYLRRHQQTGRTTQIVFESRGKTVDRATHEEFVRVLAASQPWGYRTADFSGLPLEALFISKHANVAGHQLADQVARPLALRTLHPDRPSHLLPCLERKLLAEIEFPKQRHRGSLPTVPHAWQRALADQPFAHSA